MAKVIYSIGATLKPRDYESIRGDLVVEVDTDGDVDAQIAAAIEVQTKIAVAAEPALGTQLANLSGFSIEGVGITPQFLAFKAFMQKLNRNIIGEVTKHKLTLEKAQEDGVLKIVLPPETEEKPEAKTEEPPEVKAEEPKAKSKNGRRKKQGG